MREVSARLDADLGKPATEVELPGSKTVADQIAFLALHHSYHVGQMCYIRKSLGFPALVG